MLAEGAVAAPTRQLDTGSSVSAQTPKVLLIAAWLSIYSSIYTQCSTMQSLLSTPRGRFANVLLALIPLFCSHWSSLWSFWLWNISGFYFKQWQRFFFFFVLSQHGECGVLKLSVRCCMKTISSWWRLCMYFPFCINSSTSPISLVPSGSL